MANRGPNDFVWQDGAWVTRTATGGLVSMLTPLARRSNVAWFCCVSEPPDATLARSGLFTTAADQTDPRLHVVPVPLPADTYHAYYGQISNEVLWMLQHHVIGTGGFEYLDSARHQAWGRYLEANARLADGDRPLGSQARRVPGPGLPPVPAAGPAARHVPRHADPAFHAHPVSRSAGAAPDPRSHGGRRS